jgi:hypothetical protein
MLSPEEFGTYMAVGTKKRSRGQAIYFELDQEMMKDSLPLDYIEKKCVPNERGEPKRSVYLSIYRVLESCPLRALKNLYLATNDGRVLEMQKAPYSAAAEREDSLHLYQEISPVTSRIASSLPPAKFMKSITDDSQYIFVPKLIFVELVLGELASDPMKGSIKDLPYPDVDHLRDCLVQLKEDPKKLKKTVIRSFQHTVLYRTCTNGFFAGSKSELLFYPYPNLQEMNDKHYVWWRSANAVLLRD